MKCAAIVAAVGGGLALLVRQLGRGSDVALAEMKGRKQRPRPPR